jgi:hypothetical protein
VDVASVRDMRNSYSISAVKDKGKTSLWRPKKRWAVILALQSPVFALGTAKFNIKKVLFCTHRGY